MKITKFPPVPKALLYCTPILLGTFHSCQKPDEEPETCNKPNLLLILVDDLGWGQFALNKDQYGESDLNPGLVEAANALGYDASQAQLLAEQAIPTLTSLAQSGIRFTNAYVSSNVSSPSRAGIMTASCGGRFGFYNLSDGQGSIDNSTTTMPQLMQKSGYATGSFGKVHYLPQSADGAMDFKPGTTPKEMGFDYYFGFNHNSCPYFGSKILYNNDGKVASPSGEYLTDRITQETIDFIDRNPSKPKLLYVAYNAVHEPLAAKAPDIYFNHFNQGPESLRNFYAYLYAVDQGVNKIIEKLRSTGELDNTLIVFLSDNGAAAFHEGFPPSNSPLPGNGSLAGFKGETWEGGVRVPMLLTWGDKIKTARVCESVVSSMDIFPTVLDAAGISIPIAAPVDGRSLMPIIDGDNSFSPHEELIWMCQQGDFFTLNPTVPSDPNINNAEHYASAAYASFIVRRDKWVLRYLLESNTYELYDIDADPGQKNNLAGSNKQLVDQLTESFRKWYAPMRQPTGWESKYWQEMSQFK